MLRPAKSVRRKPTAAKLRSWRVSLIRKRGQYLGTVEAPNEKAAETAAVAELILAPNGASGGSGASGISARTRRCVAAPIQTKSERKPRACPDLGGSLRRALKPCSHRLAGFDKRHG